jgi:DNA-binding response OmpR family regulator
MGDMAAPRTVGILNSTEDVIEILQELMAGEGYAARAAYIPDFKRGRDDLAAWLGDLAPTAILYDIPPPYEENWAFYRQMRALPEARLHHFIVTTTNKSVLDKLAGPSDAIEFVGRPFDLSEIAARVKAALAAIEGTGTGGTTSA